MTSENEPIHSFIQRLVVGAPAAAPAPDLPADWEARLAGPAAAPPVGLPLTDGLLPCPICGKPGQRNGRGRSGGVVCAQRTHRLQAYGDSQQTAEEVWNTRPVPAQSAPAEDRFVPTDSRTQIQMAAIIADRDGRDPVSVIAEARRIPTPVSRLTKGYANQKTDGTHMVDLVDSANGYVIARCIYEPYADEILSALAAHRALKGAQA